LKSFCPHAIYLRPIIGLSLALASAYPASAQFQRMSGNPFKPPLATIHYARNRDYHVRHLRLIFDIDGQHRSAHGVITHTLAALRDGLAAVVLDAGPNLKILSCRIDGVDRPFTHEKDALTITPAAPLARGKEVAVEITYDMPGQVRGGGANGIGGFTWVTPNPNDPERRTEFWTQGETNTNHNWAPCYDYPNDKCTSETIVTVPEDWVVIGNGTEGPITHNAAKHTRTFRWTMTQPHSTYLLSLAGGELDVRKAAWDGKTLYYVVPKGKADLIPASFGNTPDMLQFFSDILGFKYPWPKYAQDAMYDFGGGMENVSATTLGANSLTDFRSGHYVMSDLNSHELAHQWFGDYVTCKDWGDIWLNESFATFFEMIYAEHLDGKDEYDRQRESNLRQYLFEASRYQRPLSTKLYANPDVMFDSHTYPKGGLILHMLRRQLGDADFFRALGHYLKVNGLQPVDSHDLSKAIAEETGTNVEPFFDQWIYKPGHPVLDSTWSYDDAAKSVVLHIKQTQDTSNGIPIYTLPLTVALLRNTTSNTVERQTVTLNQAEQEFRLPATVKPDAVLIDPDHDLLKEIKELHWSEAELPVIIRNAPCVIDRQTAIRRFAGLRERGFFRFGNPDEDNADTPTLDAGKIQLLTDALKTEASESAGALLIEALGNAKQEALRPLLREQARSKQPGRRAAALTALGKLPRNAEDLALLRAAAKSDTEPYEVVNAALRVLGKLDVSGSMDVFAHQVEAKSLNDQLARTVVGVLASANSDAAAPILLKATASTHTTYTRTNAVRALNGIAPNNLEVHNALVSLLTQSKAPNLLEQVARTLKERGDKGAVPALRDVAVRGANEEVRNAAKEAVEALGGK
jgi:aminopeptidase N